MVSQKYQEIGVTDKNTQYKVTFFRGFSSDFYHTFLDALYKLVNS